MKIKQNLQVLFAIIAKNLTERKFVLITDKKMKIRPVFLVKGAPGSGKFKLVECLAKRKGLKLVNVDFSEIQCLSAAQTEAKLRIILQNARTSSPCILRLSNIQVNPGSEKNRLLFRNYEGNTNWKFISKGDCFRFSAKMRKEKRTRESSVRSRQSLKN